MPTSRRLTLDDIVDLRAYERERDTVRARVRQLRERRRVAVGPRVTFAFENRDTVRYQVLELARSERIVNDEGVAAELAAYNPLIPEPGELSATMLVAMAPESTPPEGLPRLGGIERAAVLDVGGDLVRGVAAEDLALQPTRDDLSSTISYVRWQLTPAQVEAFASGPVALAIDHPGYAHRVELDPAVVGELLGDLRP